MKIIFLWQGLKDCKESVGSVLLESLSDPAFNKFICLSAFASLKGVNGIGEAIRQSKSHITKFSVIVGIDQNGTSKEALEALLKLDIGASIYYTSSPIIFHPKVYVFDGNEKTRIIVGSSNITQKGLFQNVEASFKVDYTKPDQEGEDLLKQANTYLEPFFGGKIENLQKLTPDLIQQLFEAGIIPNEAEKKKAKEQRLASKKEKQENGKMDAVKKLFPTVGIQALPKGFKIEPTIKEEPQTAIVSPTPTTIVPIPTAPAPQDPWMVKGNLLWKKVLERSDVLQAKAGTNPTGGLRLTQAGYPIDQTKHFRQKIFGKLTWTVGRIKPYVEVAEVKCYVKILGNDKGIHRFTLRHKPSGEAHQHNYTTSLSWGGFGIEITKTNLAGKTLSLYTPQTGQEEPFYIEIR